ncbi:protein phosphatase 2C domain-containing protein [Candidatus Kaiserbacteria bacterium]|nr:protein phosphatase 2C domain-containing protein [Candidatus Kaiserbacteria bacterium]
MKLYTDHAFHIGKPHLTGGTPCQDYALSGIHGDGAYAVVSDGCSRGRETDVGARLIAHAMRMELCEKGLQGGDLPSLQARLPLANNPWGLSEQDMLATVIGAYATKNSGAVHLYGDGVIAFKYRDGTVNAIRYEWSKNAPFYPAYCSAEALAGFGALYRDQPYSVARAQSHLYKSGIVSRHALMHSLCDGMKGFHYIIGRWEMYLNLGLEYVAVFTDGVTQVDGMYWEDVVKELLAFKTIEGSFAKRRLMAFVRNAEKNGRGCLDDIAYAVIRIDKEEKNGKNT